MKFLSLHILVVGNVITVRLQEGDYGNPFVLNLCLGGGMVYTIDSKSIARKGVRVRLPPKAQKDLENRNIFVIFVVESSLILLFYIWRVSDLD